MSSTYGKRRMKYTVENKKGSESRQSSDKKRSQKAKAKEHMNDLNQQMGHQDHYEEDLKRKNKSLTLKAAHELCVKYLN